MKPVNKNAAYICDVRLRENKPWYRSPADAERNTRRFWKRQASKVARYRPRYDDDPVWDALFARSQDMLKAMADEALEDARAGRTMPLDPDAL